MSKMLAVLATAGLLVSASAIAGGDKFEEADANGDGKLAMEEAKQAMPDLTEEKFNSADKNGDGMLSASEFEMVKMKSKDHDSMDKSKDHDSMDKSKDRDSMDKSKDRDSMSK